VFEALLVSKFCFLFSQSMIFIYFFSTSEGATYDWSAYARSQLALPTAPVTAAGNTAAAQNPLLQFAGLQGLDPAKWGATGGELKWH
jgi:hypothetical protein